MSWAQVRACEARGASFAPHTVTHPILAAVDESRARHEIVESWRRVREMVESPVPVFAYPNGAPWTFSRRDVELVRAAGLRGAVVTTPGDVSVGAGANVDAEAPFRLPRFYLDADPLRLMQVATGVARLRVGGMRGRHR
jgi:peptidoglycan/xylan/chitin deacetylase (PgdA/CDA1 family)